MAYQIVVTEYFEETTANTIRWLEAEWSSQSADKFEKKLKAAIERISKSPTTGKLSSHFKNIRSVLVTKHNRIYYKMEGEIIILLELFETKQSPQRNKYD
jgi:plasmid stabilization system protein ParE